jgi:hypothetical protein
LSSFGRTNTVADQLDRLRKCYGAIAWAVLHDPDFRQGIEAIFNSEDPSLKKRLADIRRDLDAGRIPYHYTDGPGWDKVKAMLRQFQWPHDWALLVWTAAATCGERALCPLHPNPTLLSGPHGLYLGFSARQWMWWSAGAMEYACRVLRTVAFGTPARGRPMDYPRAQHLEKQMKQYGGWTSAWKQEEVGPMDPTALRRRVQRLRRRRYR